MPLDERIAAFLTASADVPPPASLAEMRAATETGLRLLQGETAPSGGVRDYTVVAADGHRIALRAYLPAGKGALPHNRRCCSPTAAAGASVRCRCMTSPARRWLTPPAG